MINLQSEPGCLYDTSVFLSRWIEENSTDIEKHNQPNNPYYEKLKERIDQSGIPVPNFLHPFVCRYKNRPPLLYSLLFEGRPYSSCTYENAVSAIKNRQYVSRRFIEYFFDSSDQTKIFKKVQNHPSGIDMIKKQSFDQALELYVYYTIIRYDEIIQSLLASFKTLYAEIENERREFLMRMPEFAVSLQVETNKEKLKAISKIQKEVLQFSFSLMDAQKIDFNEAEPGFFLLGYRYQDTLNTQHKYINTNPFSFAQAIGNPTRYDIYRALLETSPMTRAEMGKKLHLSRAALDHNLKAMCDAGMLVLDHKSGLTYYYRLDFDYIRIVAENMLKNIK